MTIFSIGNHIWKENNMEYKLSYNKEFKTISVTANEVEYLPIMVVRELQRKNNMCGDECAKKELEIVTLKSELKERDIEIEELKKINKDANTMIGVNCDELHKIIKEKDIEIEELKFGIREIVGRDFSEGAYLAKVEKYTALEARYYELQSKLKQKDIEIEEILNDTNAFQSELKTCKEEIEGYEIAKKDAFDYQFELEQENKRLREALVDINVNAMQRYKWKRDSNEDSKGWLLINMLASQAIISYQDKKGKE